MEDSQKIYLSLSLESSLSSIAAEASELLVGEQPTFAEFILDFDEELKGSGEEMLWLRVGLFKLYNLFFDLDIDDFTNSSNHHSSNNSREHHHHQEVTG
jgi:hypothetical protein